MNHNVTSREAILATCRNMVMTQDISSIDIRTVAKNCNVSIGSIYNYYPSKADLVMAIVEEVWRDILSVPEEFNEGNDFLKLLQKLLDNIRQGKEKYPGFPVLHAAGFNTAGRAAGKMRMANCLENLKQLFLRTLKKDPQVRPEAFTGTLTAEALSDFTLATILTMLINPSMDEATFIAVIQNCIR